MLSGVATGLTFLKNFSGPCLLLAIAGAGVGSCTAGLATHKWMEARVLTAEKTLAEYKGEVAEALATAASKQIEIRDQVLEEYSNANQEISALAGELRGLRRDVRLCSSRSSMQVPGTAAPADPAASDGQPRAADAVLQELAAFIAERSDRQAAQFNALIEWLTQTRETTSDER